LTINCNEELMIVGHGNVGLTNHNQCYITLISKSTHSTWMGRVVPAGSEAEQLPFSRFVLAAPHDDGMNSMLTWYATLFGPCAPLTTAKSDEVLGNSDDAMVVTLTKYIPALAWVAEHIDNAIIAKVLPNSNVFCFILYSLLTLSSHLRLGHYAKRHNPNATRYWRSLL
jgi:hypothetical protein